MFEREKKKFYIRYNETLFNYENEQVKIKKKILSSYGVGRMKIDFK